MLMTSPKMIVLRLWVLTLGRSALLERLLRWVAVELLIRRRRGRQRYVASARFFDMRELGE